MKSKKLLLGSLTAMATVAAPIAAVVSCSGVSYDSLAKKIEAISKAGLEKSEVTTEDFIKQLKDVFMSVKGKDGKDIKVTDIAGTKPEALAIALNILGKAFPEGAKKAAAAAKAKAEAEAKAAK